MNHDYFTRDEGSHTLSFPNDWRQTFHHVFLQTNLNESVVLNNYLKDPNNEICLQILILLFNFTFATKNQILRILRIKKYKITEETLDKLLEQYVNNRLLNAFCLSVFPKNEIPEDAFLMYCLDHGAKFILTHFYCLEAGSLWKSINCRRESTLINKYIVTNEFYISLYESKRDNLYSFEPTFNFKITARSMRVSALFTILNHGQKFNFVLDVMRKTDIPAIWRHKVTTQYTDFIQEGHWKKYFKTKPTFIFIAEDSEQATEMAQIFSKSEELLEEKAKTVFRMFTDEGLVSGFETAKIYKYQPQKDILTPVQSLIFRPEIPQKGGAS